MFGVKSQNKFRKCSEKKSSFVEKMKILYYVCFSISTELNFPLSYSGKCSKKNTPNINIGIPF
ncbi:MAG: hypothetical protein D6714_14040 [Bacteroidetes bacterium]|nr:MAG: hypothetical protein D6714_14040 [Bacteroidota bacterium]